MTPDPIVRRDAARFIPVACPTLGEEEAQAAYDCVMGGRISQGPLVEQFEQEFAQAHGKKHGVAVSNGTNALLLALVAAGIQEDCYVAVPTLTMVAAGNVIVHLGATPVFVDSEPTTGNPDPEWADRQPWSDDSRPDAILATGLYGVPPTEFIARCWERWPSIPVIEDLCECHYAAPTSGDFLCFSFYGNKIIAAGEGGIICTDNERAAERMRSLRSHAFSPTRHFDHTELAYACRWSDLQASIALIQHRRAGHLLRMRRMMVAVYEARLSEIPWLTMPTRIEGSVWWVMPVLCPDETTRDHLRAVLAEEGVETRTYFHPLHLQRHLRRFAVGEYPVAEDLARRGLYLPLSASMTIDDVEYICDIVESAVP